MANGITVSVDARQALVKFSPAGIPAAVRNNLRRVLPGLTKRLGGLIESKLDSGLKSRRRLVVKKEMVENPTAVYGRVRTISTSEPYLLPLWLEEGTKAHAIEAKNARALYFFWEKMGKHVSFKRVMHPGFKGIHYSRDAFSEMESEIRNTLEVAAREGVGMV